MDEDKIEKAINIMVIFGMIVFVVSTGAVICGILAKVW
jgi:hypothetical protein